MEILKTQDYNLFKILPGNRETRKSHIKKLAESIARNTNLTKYVPILVNKEFHVIDGQHRMEAMKLLELPIHYIQADELGLEDAQILNSGTKSWLPVDYADSFSRLGNRHYKKYLEFKSEYRLNHDVLLSFLGLDEPVTSEMFKLGRFKAKDIESSHDLCKSLLALQGFYNGFKRRSCALGFKRLWSHKDYNHSIFMDRLKTNPGSLVDHALPQEYLDNMVEIYNQNTRKDQRVEFAGSHLAE